MHCTPSQDSSVPPLASMGHKSHGLTYQLEHMMLKDLAPPALGLKPAHVIKPGFKLATDIQGCQHIYVSGVENLSNP
jgi:hypothetical protein